MDIKNKNYLSNIMPDKKKDLSLYHSFPIIYSSFMIFWQGNNFLV